MSLVGPRPPLPSEVGKYEQDVTAGAAGQPGMTGLWQVSGRCDLPWDDAVRLDLYYVENWSMSSTWSSCSRPSRPCWCRRVPDRGLAPAETSDPSLRRPAYDGATVSDDLVNRRTARMSPPSARVVPCFSRPSSWLSWRWPGAPRHSRRVPTGRGDAFGPVGRPWRPAHHPSPGRRRRHLLVGSAARHGSPGRAQAVP